MTARVFFYRPDGVLRAPWRIIGFLLATITAWVILGSVASALIPPAVVSPVHMWLVPLLAAMAGHVVMMRWIDGRPWSAVGLGREDARRRVVVIGFLVGAAAILLPSALLLAAGWLRPVPTAHGDWVAATLRITAILLPAALAEELLLRGYIFAVLREAIGWRVTLIVTSVVFGLLHLANPNSGWQPTLLVIMAGSFLGGVLLVTGSLYAAWMAHFAWNWVLAGVLHAAVSGVPLDAPGYRVVDSGPDWATGGPWGPEGGAGAALGMTLGLGYL